MPDQADALRSLFPQKKTASRSWAIAYYKATGRSVYIYVNQARREPLVDMDYVEWLEAELAKACKCDGSLSQALNEGDGVYRP